MIEEETAAPAERRLVSGGDLQPPARPDAARHRRDHPLRARRPADRGRCASRSWRATTRTTRASGPACRRRRSRTPAWRRCRRRRTRRAWTTSSSSASRTSAPLLHRQRAGVPPEDLRVRLRLQLMAEIGAATRLVALLGHPVAHSLSPRMQNAAFAARGLDWAYVALDVPPERLADAVHGLAAAGFAGANVTAPHKGAVAAIVGGRGAVGQHARLRGRSDGRPLDRCRRARRARGRTPGRARLWRRGRGLRSKRCRDARAFSRRGDWPPDVGGRRPVVNATSVRDEVLVELGRGTDARRPAVPGDGDAPRRLVARARASSTGSRCSCAQGAASFELWTGIPAPVEVMRAAVRS